MAAPTQPSKRSTAKTQATPESQTQFLYLILKQLDLKTVNWQDVADGIGIKNGHAARMRWCRFKAQTEGLPTQSTKKKRTSEKDGGKESNCKKSARVGGGMQEAMMDDRESKRVKIEHGYPGGPQMHYPAPPATWASYPPGHCMVPLSAAGMHQMIKHEHGIASIKMEPNAELHSHGPPFGPWLGRLPAGAPMGPSPPMHETMTPTQIFAMHGYASNIDPDDLPIKQSQLGVPGTVSLADMHMRRATEEHGINDIDMHNNMDGERSCPAVDEPTSSNHAVIEHEQSQPTPAAANQPSPPLHSIPLHQPGPDSPSSSTDDMPNEPAQQPLPQQQVPTYEANYHHPTAFPMAPHLQHYNMPFTYPYSPSPPLPPHDLRLAQPTPQPGYPYMTPPYNGGYPHGPPQLGPSPYRGIPPAAYAPLQPNFPLAPFDAMPANPMSQPLPHMHMQTPHPQQHQQHQLPFGPIPEYVPFGTAPPATTTITAAAAAGGTTPSAAETSGNIVRECEKGGQGSGGAVAAGKGGKEGGDGDGDGSGSGKGSAAELKTEEKAESEVGGMGAGGMVMPLEPQFVVPVQGEGEGDGVAVGALSKL